MLYCHALNYCTIKLPRSMTVHHPADTRFCSIVVQDIFLNIETIQIILTQAPFTDPLNQLKMIPKPKPFS